MKLNNEQKTITVSNNTENIERYNQISLQNYIDNHYKCDVFESGINEQYEQFKSKINGKSRV